MNNFSRYLMRPFIIAASLSLALPLLLTGCDKQETAETQVRAFIQTGVDAVEKRSVSDVKELIADDYKDTQGHDRKMLLRTLTGYFLGHKNIHVLTDIRHIHFPDAQHAEIQLLAGMAGQPASDLASLFDIRANVYKFDLRLVRDDDDWLLLNARWSPATRDDVFKP